MMNVFDLVLERTIPLSRSFAFRPSFGVEGAIVRQNLSVDYQDYSQVYFSQIPPPPILIGKVSGKNNIWGVGPKIGLWMDFCLPSQFSLDVLTSISGLFGFSSAKTHFSDIANASKNPSRAI